MGPLISVIIPVFNAADYVGFCLNSIIKQTYRKLEIIVVDDGSTDGSGDICDFFSRQDDRIRVFHKTNGGLSDARNFGMSKAKGDFYAFIDSDDLIHEDFFKTLMDLQAKYNADIVSTDLFVFYNHSEIKEKTFDKKQETILLFNHDELLKEYFKPKTDRIIYHGLCMKIYKRELFDDLLFSVGRYHEDLYITYKLLDKCDQFLYINKPYYYYYQSNPISICHNYSVKNFEDECDALFLIHDYFRNSKIKEEVRYFLVLQYFEVFKKAIDYIDAYNKTDRRRQVISWEKNNLWKIKDIPLFKKLLIYLSISNMKAYVDIRDSIKRVLRIEDE